MPPIPLQDVEFQVIQARIKKAKLLKEVPCCIEDFINAKNLLEHYDLIIIEGEKLIALYNS
jgi:hypothetical protein